MSSVKLHRIRIKGFRRIQDELDVSLTTPRGEPAAVVTFAGPNGCGKTSVLEAVLLGLGLGSLIVRDLQRSEREEHWRVAVPHGAEIKLDVSIGDNSPVTWVRTDQRHYVSGTETDLQAGDCSQLAVQYFSSWRAPELVGPVKPLLGRGARPSDNENNRLWRLKQRINDERARAGYGGAISGQNKANAWLERLNRAWARFHGSDGTLIDAQVAAPDEEDLLADLFVLDREGKRICSIDQISAGEIELVSVAGAIILNDWDGGVLMIDEPELHLHPQWQATMLPALQELAPNMQLLVASHADAVWEQASSFARFLLVPDDDSRSSAWRDSRPSHNDDAP